MSLITHHRRLFSAFLILFGISLANLAEAQSNPSVSKRHTCGVQVSSSSQETPTEFLVVNGEGEVLSRIDEISGESEKALAQHLADNNAVVYTAFWCPHCHEQLRLFGVEAIATLNIVECDPEGKNPQSLLCDQKFQQAEAATGERAGYPTWEINGKFYVGTRLLDELSELSDYQGPQDFLDRPDEDTPSETPASGETFFDLFWP